MSDDDLGLRLVSDRPKGSDFPPFAPRPRYRQRALTPWRPIEAKAVDAPEAE
jgi:hypothetical protein